MRTDNSGRGRANALARRNVPLHDMWTKLTLSYVTRGRSLRCGRFDDPFQPCDVFQQTPSGQNKEVVAELRILKVNFKQPLIRYAKDLSVFDALDRPGASVIGRKESKFSHDTPRRKLDADFLDQKLPGDDEEHFGSRITLLE